jgi:hypothetical protein
VTEKLRTLLPEEFLKILVLTYLGFTILTLRYIGQHQTQLVDLSREGNKENLKVVVVKFSTLISETIYFVNSVN